MANSSFTGKYDALPLIARILIQIVFGAIVGGIYRIVRYCETKKTSTLVCGIVALIPALDVFFWIVDLITLIANKKYTFFAD